MCVEESVHVVFDEFNMSYEIPKVEPDEIIGLLEFTGNHAVGSLNEEQANLGSPTGPPENDGGEPREEDEEDTDREPRPDGSPSDGQVRSSGGTDNQTNNNDTTPELEEREVRGNNTNENPSGQQKRKRLMIRLVPKHMRKHKMIFLQKVLSTVLLIPLIKSLAI